MDIFRAERANSASRLSTLPSDMAVFYLEGRYLRSDYVRRACDVSSEHVLGADGGHLLDYDFAGDYLVVLFLCLPRRSLRSSCVIVVVDMARESIMTMIPLDLDTTMYYPSLAVDMDKPIIFLSEGKLRLSYTNYSRSRVNIFFDLAGQPLPHTFVSTFDEPTLPKRSHHVTTDRGVAVVQDPSTTLLVKSEYGFGLSVPVCADLVTDTLIYPGDGYMYFSTYNHSGINLTEQIKQRWYSGEGCNIVSVDKVNLAMNTPRIMFINKYHKLVLIGGPRDESRIVLHFLA